MKYIKYQVGARRKSESLLFMLLGALHISLLPARASTKKHRDEKPKTRKSIAQVERTLKAF